MSISPNVKKGAVFNFGTMRWLVMDNISEEICSPGKAVKRYDVHRLVYLHVDFSNEGLGAQPYRQQWGIIHGSVLQPFSQ